MSTSNTSLSVFYVIYILIFAFAIFSSFRSSFSKSSAKNDFKKLTKNTESKKDIEIKKLQETIDDKNKIIRLMGKVNKANKKIINKYTKVKPESDKNSEQKK